MAFEWNGTQRWLAETDSAGAAAMARQAGGHATLFRADASGGKAEVFEPLPRALMTVHRAVKQVFDPAGILNPGRMYSDL
jgi:glycolate oxidase FAD binding subunit